MDGMCNKAIDSAHRQYSLIPFSYIFFFICHSLNHLAVFNAYYSEVVSCCAVSIGEMEQEYENLNLIFFWLQIPFFHTWAFLLFVANTCQEKGLYDG